VRAPIGRRVRLRPHEPRGSRPSAPRMRLQRGARTYAPLDRARPVAVVAPRRRTTLRTHAPLHRVCPRPCAPHGRSRPTRRLRPHVRTPRDVRAYGSRSHPTAYTPLEYKFIKIVVHSTTWASRPSTTVRWMTAGCLDGDHSFLIHSHGPRAHPRTRLYACLI
jgi:hypothetical protein